MRKRLTFLFALMLVASFIFTSSSFAVTNNRIRSTNGIETSSTASTLGLSSGTWVYGVTVYADAASSFVALYDASTYVGKTVANAVTEVGEATQYESVTVWFPKPIYFANGVSCYIATGVAYIYYGPEPSPSY